jgi:hypothetical protein
MKKTAWVIIILITVASGTLYLYIQNNRPRVISPAKNEQVEIGDPYQIRWKNKPSHIPDEIAIHSFGRDGEDMGYAPIATSSIPSNGILLLNIPDFDMSLKYKITLFDKDRNILQESEDFFTLKDEKFVIDGGPDIVINPRNIFSFGTPFTITGITPLELSNGSSSAVFSSSKVLSVGQVTVRFTSFHEHSCEVLPYASCDTAGDQAVRVIINTVVESRGKHYVTRKSLYLTSHANKIQVVQGAINESKYKYEIELISIDAARQQATLIVRKVDNSF